MDRHAWDERYEGRELVWSADPNQFLVVEVADLPAGRALDLACDEGRNAIWLASRGWDATGMDFSRVALDKAQRVAESRGVTVAWVEGDVVADPLPTGEFDLVIILYLHIPAADRDRAFTKAAAAVRPGGTFLLVGHDATNLTAGYGGPQYPEVLYGPQDVLAYLDGYTIVKAERVERVVTTEDGPRTAIDLLVRATRPPPRPADPRPARAGSGREGPQGRIPIRRAASFASAA